jgi:hypothetical protein
MNNPFVSIFTVDSFTQKPFRGNPAAVCLFDEYIQQNNEHLLDKGFLAYPADILQSVAQEVRRFDIRELIPF